MKIQCKGRLIDFQVPKIMGILNITADSFYDGGRYNTRDTALQQVDTLLEEGADCIDVGAASSRPGAAVLTAEEEGQRLYPILEALVARFPDTLFSVDTYNSGTAIESVARGAALINDISGGTMDPKMLSTVGKLKVPYIMAHLQGTPQNMQQQPQYENVVTEVLHFFSEKVQTAYAAGIDDVIVDPGFGFGKTIEHNYSLLKALDRFHSLSCPVMVGLSRKSMIYKLLDISAEEALNGTTVLHAFALQKGAHLLRVHDVKYAKECVQLWQALQ